MSEEVANKLLKPTVAQLLLPVGWHNITNTSVQVLVDVMRRYIESVGKITSGYAEHGSVCVCVCVCVCISITITIYHAICNCNCDTICTTMCITLT